jgi:hypothetical protein
MCRGGEQLINSLGTSSLTHLRDDKLAQPSMLLAFLTCIRPAGVQLEVGHYTAFHCCRRLQPHSHWSWFDRNEAKRNSLTWKRALPQTHLQRRSNVTIRVAHCFSLLKFLISGLSCSRKLECVTLNNCLNSSLF